MADIKNIKVYDEACTLEKMTYRTRHKIPNTYKFLWDEIITEASAICDGLCDTYYIPKEMLQDKFNAASFAMSHLVRMERKLDIVNAHDVQAISNEMRATYDIQIHNVRVQLQGWLNSLSKKISGSQISAVTPVGENS